MRRSRIALLFLPLIAAVAAVWLLLVSPSRNEASELASEAAVLRADVTAQEEAANAAEAARKDFPSAYRRIVVLGKAAPDDDDTSSFLFQLNSIAKAANVDFRGLESDGGGESAAAPAPQPQTPAETAEGSEQEVANAESGTGTPTAGATEAQAASLPIGASVGAAGLPVMKYSLTFSGKFFELADFFEGLDEFVRTRGNGTIAVKGRLVTVDGFELKLPPSSGTTGSAPSGGASPELEATVRVTTYLTPAEEGVSAGASPAGPAPATEAQPVGSASAPSTTATASAPTP